MAAAAAATQTVLPRRRSERSYIVVVERFRAFSPQTQPRRHRQPIHNVIAAKLQSHHLPDRLLPILGIVRIEYGLPGQPVEQFVKRSADRVLLQVLRFQQSIEAPVCSGFRVGESQSDPPTVSRDDIALFVLLPILKVRSDAC